MHPLSRTGSGPILHLSDSYSELVSGGDVRLACSRVKKELRRSGILPFTDTKVPSLVSLVAGGPVSGSWWGHPQGQLIYQVGEALESDPEVLTLRLWDGKLTLVQRRLMAGPRQNWQSPGRVANRRAEGC